jgi:hypothetical protein
VLTFAISWLTLGWVALASHELLPFNIPSGLNSLLLLVGSSGPLLAALLLVATTTGKSGHTRLFPSIPDLTSWPAVVPGGAL